MPSYAHVRTKCAALWLERRAWFVAPDGVTGGGGSGGGGRRMRFFIVSSTGSHWKVEGNDPVRVLKDDLRHGKLQFSLPQVRK